MPYCHHHAGAHSKYQLSTRILYSIRIIIIICGNCCCDHICIEYMDEVATLENIEIWKSSAEGTFAVPFVSLLIWEPPIPTVQSVCCLRMVLLDMIRLWTKLWSMRYGVKHVVHVDDKIRITVFFERKNERWASNGREFVGSLTDIGYTKLNWAEWTRAQIREAKYTTIRLHAISFYYDRTKIGYSEHINIRTNFVECRWNMHISFLVHINIHMHRFFIFLQWHLTQFYFGERKWSGKSN